MMDMSLNETNTDRLLENDFMFMENLNFLFKNII